MLLGIVGVAQHLWDEDVFSPLFCASVEYQAVLSMKEANSVSFDFKMDVSWRQELLLRANFGKLEASGDSLLIYKQLLRQSGVIDVEV